MKTITKIITRFDKGMTNDLRNPDTRFARLIKNFDYGTYAHKLVPHFSSEDGNANASTDKLQTFCVAMKTATTSCLYGLGVVSGTVKAEILYKNLSLNSDNDLDDDDWTHTGNYQSPTGTTNFELFVYYKKTGLIYGVRANRYIWAYDPDGGSSWDNSVDSFDFGSTATNVTQGLVHSKDDIMYFAMNNKVIKNNNGTISVALTLPTDKVVTSLCEYGNLLAIACAPLSGIGQSIVYLWDRDSSLETLSESVDWGEGSLKILEEIEGHLIGISMVANSGAYAEIGAESKLVFRQYSGGEALVFQELIDTTSTRNLLQPYKQKVDQYLYFSLATTIDGTSHRGIWKIGRVRPTDPFAITIDRNYNNNDTGDATIKGFYILGDYVFVSYIIGSTYYLNKTAVEGRNTYDILALLETLKITGGDSSQEKKLIGTTLTFESLPSGAKASLAYKKDEETTWTTIIDEFDTANAISKSAVNISGATLPIFKEIQFQLSSTGGAVLTGLKYKYEELNKDIY